MTRLEKIINNPTIYNHIITTYKTLLKEGNKQKIEYFKALIKGCINKNHFEGGNPAYLSIKDFLWETCNHDFLKYTNESYYNFLNKNDSFPFMIYGYKTKTLLKTIF